MACILLLFCVLVFSGVFSKPIENEIENKPIGVDTSGSSHSLWKRFVNPALNFVDFSDDGISKMRTKRFINPDLMYGSFNDAGLVKMRTKRSEEECEKLTLCKLHARSRRNFLAAFQLYFVNKENARLWDHQAHSIAECERRFGGCYR